MAQLNCILVLIIVIAMASCDLISVALVENPFSDNLMPVDALHIEARRPDKMRDPIAAEEVIMGTEKGYGYPSYFGYHHFGHPGPQSSHHGHHFAGYEYESTTGAHGGAPHLHPYGLIPQGGYSYGAQFGSSEYNNHGFGGHQSINPYGGAVPQSIFGQIGQGNVNHGFPPVGYSGYGYNSPVFNYNSFPSHHQYSGYPYSFNSYNIQNSNHHNHQHQRHQHHHLHGLGIKS